MVLIDGSHGEGGGQVLRTSLALSLVTGRGFRIENIRAGRKRPGLMRQHLTAVNAARKVGEARAKGVEMGSKELTFEPGPVRSGDYRFAVGTAGSATLVLQTVLPALMLASGSSRLVLEGGTHNPYAPPLDFLDKAFLPIVNRMGPTIRARLVRHGFYPAGGGRFEVEIEPTGKLRPIECPERGEVRATRVVAIASNLPRTIAEREVRVVCGRMSWPEECASVAEVKSQGPGNAVVIEVESEHITEVFTAFGQRGVRAEQVAKDVAAQARDYLDAGVPVGRHLADQLLIPMALAGGGAFRTVAPTRHTRTNCDILKHFLDVSVSMEQEREDRWRVEIGA